jgi:protein SCO1/2
MKPYPAILSCRSLVLCALGALLALSPPSRAQLNVGNYGRVPDTGFGSAQARPQDDVLSQVHWEQKLDSQLPLEAEFKDESGKTVQFGKYFGGHRPVVLAMIFYNCTMLCSEVLNGMMHSMHEVNLTPGKDFDVVVVSINPKEDSELARGKKKNYLAEYKFSKEAAGFHFLTGTEENIKKVTNAAGYFYTYDPKTEQFAHPGGIVVVTPEGKVARYFTGVLFSARDLRLTLVEASQGKIGSLRDLILLRCFHYDSGSNKYTLAVMEVLRIVGALFVLVVGGGLGFWVWRDVKKSKAEVSGAGENPDTLSPPAAV